MPNTPEKEEKPNSIYDLKLHEKVNLGSYLSIMRVPGGWIYLFSCPPGEGNDLGVFVPFDNEFWLVKAAKK